MQSRASIKEAWKEEKPGKLKMITALEIGNLQMVDQKLVHIDLNITGDKVRLRRYKAAQKSVGHGLLHSVPCGGFCQVSFLARN